MGLVISNLVPTAFLFCSVASISGKRQADYEKSCEKQLATVTLSVNLLALARNDLPV